MGITIVDASGLAGNQVFVSKYTNQNNGSDSWYDINTASQSWSRGPGWELVAFGSTANAQRRERWHSYFERTLLGNDGELEAATEAAMRADGRGDGQQAIVAAGLAAARAHRNGGSAEPPPFRAASPRQTAPPRKEPQGKAAQSAQSPRQDARPKRIWPPGSAVVGTVEKRTESMDGQFFQTWSFRLFRLEDGLDTMMERLNRDHGLGVPNEVGHRLKSTDLHGMASRDVEISPALEERLRELYAEDFRRFGF